MDSVLMRAVRNILVALALVLAPASAIADVWVGNGGSWHLESAPYAGVSGSYHAWKNAWVGSGGSWHLFYTAFSASASPTLVSCHISGAGTCTTISTTCTPSGGTAPYTYSWSVSGDASITATNPTSATTSFTSHLASGADKSATGFCTITDNNGNQVSTSGVGIEMVSQET